jgi:hypothetical protein
MNFASGSLGGMTACIVSYPLDLARIRIAGHIGSRYTGLFQTLALTTKEEGWRGCYRGLTPALLGAIPFEGTKFCTYDVLQSYLPRDESGHTSIGWKVSSGAAAGLLAGVACFPNDTVRRLCQIDSGVKVKKMPDGGVVPKYGEATVVKRRYRGMIHCYQQTYRYGGITRFYRGLTPDLIRRAPNTAIQFAMYETFKQWDLEVFGRDGGPEEQA